MKRAISIALIAAFAVAAIGYFAIAQGPDAGPAPVDLTLKANPDVPAADARTDAIVAAADRFLGLLSESQRKAAVYPFADNAQRANWSNFPEGMVHRGGVRRGDLTEGQRTALDALIAEVMSAEGARNIAYQMAADDSLGADGGGRANFGSSFFYTSFLGEPSTTAPWMFQFGGHHLALNVTVFGPDISFAPMLTGGQPLHITYGARTSSLPRRRPPRPRPSWRA